ncbi:MAG: M1 family metallopeptidase, partial [Chitinophagaceae bacterium]|nr:M1 family metallopeptidase [Chitinophagaceae bacterium]
MRALIVVVITCLLLPLTGIGQPTQVAQECSRSKIFNASAKTTLASPDELKYDVRHVHIDISLDNTSVAIAGKATTTALVTEGNFALYVFELNSKLAIDSVSINGKDAVFVRTDNLVKTFMPSLLQTGDVFSATVYYHGLPDAGSVFFFQSGMNNAPAEEWNSTVTYTLSEPFNSKDWWPCKQYLEDKIDSADIWITVPDSLKAGSNGLLQRVTSLAGNKKRFEWKTTYPIAYYLLSVSVAAYDEYSFTRTMPDGKEVLVQNYLYDRQNVLDSFKNRLDTTGEMLYYFSELFGTYPFHKEKYGHCMAPVFGGMEHQTMTTLHNFNAALVAHELTHQWFGDNVTCGTWRDVWLNEGFASYGEYLFAEKFWGDTAALKYIQKVHDIVLDDTVLTGSIYMSEAEANNPYRIFDGRLSYQKASSVLHMLRYIINNDNLF